MAYAEVSAARATVDDNDANNTLQITMGAQPSAGSLLVAWIFWQDDVTISTVADSVNGSWSLVGSRTAGGGGFSSWYGQLAYLANASGSGGAPTVTVTMSGAATYIRARATEFTGGATASPLDQNSGTSGNDSKVYCGSMTPTEDGELFVAGFADENDSGPYTAMATPAFTAIHAVSSDGWEYYVQPTAAAVNPEMTASMFAGFIGVGATFKVAAAGGPATATPGTGAVQYTSLVPTISATQARTVTPAQGVVSFVGLAPTLGTATDTTATPGTGALSFTATAAGIDIGLVAATITTTSTVAVGITADINITPTQGTVSFTGYAPTITTPLVASITPAQGVLAYTGLAPTITAISTILVTPGIGRVTYRGKVPTITGTRIRIVGWGFPIGARGSKKLVVPPTVDEHDVFEGHEVIP